MNVLASEISFPLGAIMKFLLTLILLSLLSCKTDSNRTIHFSELGWSFELPSELTFTDSAFSQNQQIDKSLWDTTSFDSRSRIELFWIKPSKNTYFNTIIYIDSSDFKKWNNDILSDSRFYIGLANQTPQLKILDTLLSTENIDGVNLQKEYIKIFNTVTKDTSYSLQIQ